MLAVSRVRLVRCWLVFLVFGWSCSMLRYTAPEISGNTHHGPHRITKKMDRTINTNTPPKAVGCSQKEPLVVETGDYCVSEKFCQMHKRTVHWIKRQCLSNECPPGYIDIDYYCSLNKTCSTKRISSLSRLSSLRNCRIIEGSLEIVLIRDVSEEQWSGWSFPELVEITEFLMVYQVEGLRSLGQLFPNLAVIRGMKLWQHYSLIIYNTHLVDIGLYSLGSILRGSVRIQNNINLCYVQTINWNAITNSSLDNVLTGNGEALCKNCCPSCYSEESMEESCQYCWNSTVNQHMCGQCESGCTAEKQCCHEECVGGCEDANNDYACHACRHFTTGHQCVKTCGEKLQYKDYRCVSKQYCQREGLKQFNGTQCVAECPSGYQNITIHGMNVCQECQSCERPCHGMLVNTVARAQDLRGCKTIDGSLIISIRYGKAVTRELESSLGTIEKVTHSVRIFKTSTLKSLNFLRSLKVIEGKQLYNDKYALFVHENANLEDIWDFNENRKLNITKGKIFFFSNPKLCYNGKIDKLLNLTGQEEDYSMRFTNGDKVACSIMKHNIRLDPQRYMGNVSVEWDPVFINEDDRKITGYYIYYKETNKTDIKHMDGRDACHDEWERNHEEVDVSNRKIKVYLTNLKPSRRYAVYVETDTVDDADIGVLSNISYVTTLPYNPSPPLNVEVQSKGSTYIALEWSPPASPNGNVVDYVVNWTLLKEENGLCTQDHCKNKQNLSWERQESEDVSESGVNQTSLTTTASSTAAPAECCACPRETIEVEEDDDFDFEINLNNYTYIHRTNRHKRSTDNPSESPYSNPSRMGLAPQYREYQEVKHTTEQGTLRNSNTYINITGLLHYSKYKIEVSACHQLTHEGCSSNMTDGCQLCSIHSANITETTTKEDKANLFLNLGYEDVSQSSVKAVWSPPESPNEPVLAYIVSLFTGPHVTKSNLMNETCVSCKVNQSDGLYSVHFKDLSPGTKYWLNVEAFTVAYKRPPLNLTDDNTTVSFITLSEDSNDYGQLLVIVGSLLLLVIMCGIFVFRRVRPHKLPMDEEPKPGTVAMPNAVPIQYVVDPANVRLIESIGEGNFGLVFRGKLLLGFDWINVAVKQPFNSVSQKDMLAEAKVMLELQSCHIVRAYGVMILSNKTYLVMEYMSKGDLRKYLRDQQSVLNIEEVCDMALQIADGMAYLASKNYVHRDLAARNCLMNEDKKIKISDFGMTRTIDDQNYYYVSHQQLFPVRWIAPECFHSKRFSKQSDVWSFGIVLWEILTNGRTPYEDMAQNEVVREKVSNGYTLKDSVRTLTDRWLADLICRCWESKPNSRPLFPEIISVLIQHASPHFAELFRFVSYYHNPRGHE